MQVFIKFIDGSMLNVEVEGSDTVEDFIMNMVTSDPSKFTDIYRYKIFYNGTDITTDLDETLVKLNVIKDSEVFMEIFPNCNPGSVIDKKIKEQQFTKMEGDILKLTNDFGILLRHFESHNKALQETKSLLVNIFKQKGGRISKKKRKTRRRR